MARPRLVAVLAALAALGALGDERKNYFDDPFVQVTNGLPGCPVPEGPLVTEAEARVQKAVTVNGAFKDTSVWALGQRRWVFLKGCARTREESKALEKLVAGIDDVERVVNELAVSRRPAR